MQRFRSEAVVVFLVFVLILVPPLSMGSEPLRAVEAPSPGRGKGAGDSSFAVNQGLAGAWFEEATAGQGFLIDIEPEDDFIFVTWFNFEADRGAKVGSPDQRWLTAQGSYEGAAAVDLPIVSTSGGAFDAPQPPVNETVGALTISFDSCASATVDYRLDEGLTGSISLVRLVPGSEMLCESLIGPSVVGFFDEPVPLTATPPLPGDLCPEPPGVRGQQLEAALRQIAAETAAVTAELLDPNSMTVVTCGTGSPVPSDRTQSCTAVFVGGQYLLFDAGDGAARQVEELQFPIVETDAIFLTHFHSDHMADVGEIVSRSWIAGRTEPLPIYGGPVVERVVEGFKLIYTPDVDYRVAHHGTDVFPVADLLVEARRIDDISAEGQTVYDVDGVVVKAYGVDHSPVSPALGYRVEYQGRAVGISGDTIDTPGFRALADNVDVLVSEVMDSAFTLDQACALERFGDERNGKIFRDVRTYHTDVSDVAALSSASAARNLMLTHYVPTLDADRSEQLYRPQIAPIYAGNLVVSEDGSQVVIDLR